MKNLLILYVVNLILDYPLQGTFLAEYKAKNNYILFVHCAIWALGLSLVLIPIGLFAWWKVAMLLIGHFIIDYWKCRGLYKEWFRRRYYSKFKGNPPEEKDHRYEEYIEAADVCVYSKPLISDWASLYIDQALHVVQVVLCLI